MNKLPKNDQSPNYLELAVQSKLRKTRRKVLPKPLIPKDPINLSRGYFKDLLAMTDILKELTEILIIPSIESFTNQLQGQRPSLDSAYIRIDAISDDIERMFKTLGVRFTEIFSETEIQNMARRWVNNTEKFNKAEINKNFFKVLGVNPITSEGFLQTEVPMAVKRNVDLIKSISSKHFTEIENLVMNEWQKGTLPKDITEKIRDRYKINESRAKLIARDQLGKINGQLTQLRQTNVGITQYKWQTSGDDRVRASHATKDGKIFDWDNPPADTGHPGQDFQCRCVAIPVIDIEQI